MKPEEVDIRVRAARLTVEQAHQEYVRTMRPSLRESSSKRKEALFRDYIGPVIGQRLVRSIRRADVTEVVQRVRVRFPVQGNRVFSELMALLRWCEAKGYVDGIPAVRRKDIGAREKPRRRTLTEPEVGMLWRAANSLTGPGADFVKLLLLSGQRRSEARKMSWPELALERGIWVIPAGRYKTGIDHAVPLPEPALDILRARNKPGATGFVLAGRSGPAKPFNNAERIIPRLLKLMPECAPFTLHDIRRSVRSGMARIGIDGETAEMVLGHLPQGIRKVYDTYDRIDERKDALKRWAEYVLRLADQDQSKSVVSFTRARA
jgi:integrase